MIIELTLRKNILELQAKTNRWRVLFDINILLDVLLKREPFFANSARIWALAEAGQLEGWVAGHSFTTLFYLYRRFNNLEQAYYVLRRLLQVFLVAAVDQDVITQACKLGWGDFEDAVQMQCAEKEDCGYLVTRNPQDYVRQPVRAITPADFLAVWAAQSG
jgi:predicted nucleic acid-binding protein